MKYELNHVERKALKDYIKTRLEEIQFNASMFDDSTPYLLKEPARLKQVDKKLDALEGKKKMIIALRDYQVKALHGRKLGDDLKEFSFFLNDFIAHSANQSAF